MKPSRRLVLAKETLSALDTDALALVRGAVAPPTLQRGCEVFSDLFRCFPTADGQCPPPPQAG